ncbi:MAG: type II secretion system protein GspD [Betaproteobacteria bacterium CG2_30_59_46]|nr:MAG: type II secretion system protein GspD [Betaproteobacteria bacterium CG2_30_59_46]PIQ10171.1 MAG: type II secretion system protein GspD [Hydrogenophilales bacterium CG18_big_fil_WC_8_21_14_2_50_58_12]PIX99988.1 MAG: type II secretion system protein GspD [Hydrogenophilales bacterium CG_4_10_14_3_um_filter_58_23]
MLKKWLLIGLLCCPLVAVAAEAEKEKITLNFVNADIESVVKAVGMISGKNFILDPRVKGTINIISSSPVSRELTYQILLSALRLQGFAAIEGQGVIKIVPEADAKQNYSPTSERKLAASGDKIVTQVYPLRYESASQLVPVLRPLISPNNTIAAYANTNTLVITDYADNVRRINKIIDAIDQPNNGEMVTVRLEHASATDLAQALNRLMSDSAAAAPGVAPGSAELTRRIVAIADSRTNSVLLRSDNPSLIMRARSIIAGLDIATSVAGNIHVVYLKNAEAVKLAQTLRAVMSGESAAATGGTAGQPTPLGQQVQPAGSPAASGFIQADVATNSLIITAPDNVYNTLRAAIDKLDARRAQVYVEALIAEVSTDKAAEFGIQWQFLNGVNSNSVSAIGGTNLTARGAGGNIIDAAANLSSLGQGLNIGITKGMINLPGVGQVVNLGVLARALATDANTNILSTPNLLTLDNEEAKIIIGQNVPFVTGSYAQTGTTATATPFQTIERKDVGLMLKIKPQISEGGSVKLQIYQEVSSVDNTTNTGGAGLVTNKRSIESTVLVDDGRIIVLGGLIQDTVRDGQDKVPLLGDIPLLGGLFRYDKRQRVKTNLMVFLRPYVLKDAESSASLTDSRYGYIRDQQDVSRLSQHAILPDMPVPQLPSLIPAPQTKGDSKIQTVAP